jgi:hypothetical protein
MLAVDFAQNRISHTCERGCVTLLAPIYMIGRCAFCAVFITMITICYKIKGNCSKVASLLLPFLRVFCGKCGLSTSNSSNITRENARSLSTVNAEFLCNDVVDLAKAGFSLVAAFWVPSHVLARVGGQTARHGLEMGLNGQDDCPSNSAGTKPLLDLPLHRALRQPTRNQLARPLGCLPIHNGLLHCDALL